MLVIGIEGKVLTTQERDWLQHPACAGVILFTRNFSSRNQVTELSQSIREAWRQLLRAANSYAPPTFYRLVAGFCTSFATMAIGSGPFDLWRLYLVR